MEQIKQLTAADFDEVFALSQFAFQYKLSDEALVKKKEEAERHKIWGWVENDKIAAKVHLIPLSVYIHGHPFKMGGISSVATWPEYRRNGMIKHLLAHVLKDMKDNGQTLSFLHPFSVPFYRKFGWEVAFSLKHYTIPMEKMKRNWDADGYVRRTSANIELFNRIYTEFAQGFNGTLTRDESWWNQRVLAKDAMMAVCYDANDQAKGYIFYNVKDNSFQVEEIVYTSTNGWRLLLGFIANHDSMAEEVKMTVNEHDHLPLLIDEPRFKQETTPYFMARIVDVLGFLNEYAFNEVQDTKLVIHVEDSFLAENTGVYEISQVAANSQITYLDSKEDDTGIHLNVQQLAAILLGYKRPKELAQVGLIQGDSLSIEQLEKLIPIKQPYFPDFF